MVKSQNPNLNAVIGIMFMLVASPLAVTYAQADEIDSDLVESISTKERVSAILTEQIIDGKLQVRHFEISVDASSDEIPQTLMFEGKAHGWAYVKGKAYNSGIVIFDGKAIKISDRNWRLSTQGTMELEGRNLDLVGRGHGSNVIMHETTSNDDLKFRIVLTGNITPSEEDDAIAFIHAGLKNAESGETIKLYQLGQIIVEAPEGVILQTDSLRNSILVA